MIQTSTGTSGQILCHFCNGKAACLGRYENCEGPFNYACDDCCGHGNEDGRCSRIGSDDFKSFHDMAKREA